MGDFVHSTFEACFGVLLGPVGGATCDIGLGLRGRCVKRWSRMLANPGSIPGAGDKNKGLISLPCNIRRCAPRG